MLINLDVMYIVQVMCIFKLFAGNFFTRNSKENVVQKSSIIAHYFKNV